MCFICCNVRIRSVWQSASASVGGLGKDKGISGHTVIWHLVRDNRGEAGGMSWCVVPSGQVHGTHGDGAELVWSPSPDNCAAKRSQWPEGPMLPPPMSNHSATDEKMQMLGKQLAETRRRPAVAGILEELHAELEMMTRDTTIWRGSMWSEDKISQRPDRCSESGPGHTPRSGRQRAVIPRHPGHFGLRSNLADGLNSSTPDGHSI